MTPRIEPARTSDHTPRAVLELRYDRHRAIGAVVVGAVVDVFDARPRSMAEAAGVGPDLAANRVADERPEEPALLTAQQGPADRSAE